MFPGPRAVRAKRPLSEQDRVGGLEDLQRRDGGRGDRRVAVVQPVAVGRAPVPAAVEAEHDPRSPVLAPTRDRQRVDRAVGVGDGPLRGGAGRGREDHVDHPEDRLGVAADRGGELGREQRALRHAQLDRTHDAGVGGQLREEVLDGHVGGRDGRRQRYVDRSRAARRGALEVEHHRVAADLERDAYRQRPVVDAVVVEEVLGRPAPVGKRRELGAHHGLRTCAERGERRADRRPAVLVEELVHAPHAELERRDLAGEVPFGGTRQARVSKKDVDDVRVRLPRACQPHGRQHEGLLEHVGGAGVVVSRYRAAEIVPVTDRGQPAEELPAVEVRAHEAHVGQVRAADVRVVEDEHVAVGQIPVGGHLVDDRAHGEGHDADEDRQAVPALDEGVSRVAVVEAVARVVGLGDDGVEGRSEERGVHLVGDLFHAAGEDGQRDGVDGLGDVSERACARSPGAGGAVSVGHRFVNLRWRGMRGHHDGAPGRAGPARASSRETIPSLGQSARSCSPIVRAAPAFPGEIPRPGGAEIVGCRPASVGRGHRRLPRAGTCTPSSARYILVRHAEAPAAMQASRRTQKGPSLYP